MRRLPLVLALTFAMLSANAQDDFNYDVNNDGNINVADVMLVVNKVLGINNEATSEYRPIILKVSERPLTYPTAEKTSARRAPAFTTSSLETFYLNLMYKHKRTGDWAVSDQSHTKKTSNGLYENNGSWPSNDIGSSKAHVFAYRTSYKENEQPFKYINQTPYLQISTEQSSNDQCDILVATEDVAYDDCKGVVSLTFDHVCAALQFSVIKTETLASYEVEVNEIVLHNVKTNGHYLLLSKEWSDIDNFSNFTLNAYNKEGTANAFTVSNTEATLLAKNENDFLFLIPQEISGISKGTAINEADNKSYLEIKCKIHKADNYIKGSSNSYESVFLPFSADLTNGAGHVHPFVISIGTSIRDADGNKIIN